MFCFDYFFCPAGKCLAFLRLHKKEYPCRAGVSRAAGVRLKKTAAPVRLLRRGWEKRYHPFRAKMILTFLTEAAPSISASTVKMQRPSW